MIYYFYNHLAKLAPQITQFLQYYGQTLNLKKSHLQPTQQFQYLGWIWGSTTMTVQLPKNRCLRIKNRKEKDLQKENDFCENSSNFDWDAFCYNPKHLFTLNDFPQYFILISTKKNGTQGLHGLIKH
jgi:hypothetical protein